ncbi:MAG: GNAT family N-acetyltransferase [Rhodobiaceae bacterium]|nr:GNAT family N-acetyltransferase [Rhodobiaceae bacterium]MCC0012169.1 GNAT family N-acetyltransferase [Rhodobiaceae bacterium]MCC0052082.1 GNAT family N-acetyltransferase [Rhodobiaceae bacterium]MCC0060916.1 GNAT family N-acetyltransferase [Rhodobiaceae bacterium]
MARATTFNPLVASGAKPRPQAANAHAPAISFIWGTAIDELEAEWRDLEDNAANPQPFSSFDFLWHWRAVFCVGKDAAKPFVVTVRDNARLVALLPLMITRVGPLHVCEWMGEPLTEYGDALVRHGYTNAEWLEHAIERLKACPDADVFYLRKVRANAGIAPVLDQMMSRAGEQRQAPWIDLSAVTGICDVHQRLSSNMRKELRRKRKKLDSVGTVDFCIAHAGPQAAAVTERTVSFKKAWLQQRGTISRAFADPRCTTVLNRLSADERRGQDFIVSELSVNGEAAASEVGFRSGSRYYAYIGAYNPDMAVHGPGLIQMEHTVAWCISEGIEAYDLFAPADDYKLRWTDKSVAISDYAAARTIAGKLCTLWLARIRPLAKAALLAAPQSIQTRFSRLLARG